MRKNTVFCLLAAALFIFSTAGTSLAAWKIVNESTHVINMSGVKARIVEEYEHTNNVYPGNTVDKVVRVKNTGGSDSVVRVKVEKAWGEERGEDGKLITNNAYSTDNIMIEYNEEYWVYDETDGYFYYKGVLKPDETTQAPLFKNFHIDKNTGNEYMGMQADIIVKMECVQAEADGIGVWNKTFENLGITYTKNKITDTETSVTFVGGADEFNFEPQNTDLFANFKDLLPGETRSQKILVKNVFKNNTGVEIFLHAEDIEQSLSTPATLALVNKLLREYATIIVTGETGKVIYSGPIWGEPNSNSANPASMRYDISLGTFTTGQSKRLNIQLQIDPAMGNEYQELWGRIKWVWSAEGADTSTKTNVVPPAPSVGERKVILVL